jgi:ABC-2 type transport system permease protein
MNAARRTVALVAARESGERFGSRAFLVSTLVTVAIVVAGVVVPGLHDTDRRLRAGLTDAAPPAFTAALRDAARADGARPQLRRYPNVAAGEAAVRDGHVGVLIVGGRRLVWESEPDTRLAAIATSAIRRLRWSERAAALGLDPHEAASLLEPVPIPARRLEAPDRDRDSRETIAMIGFLLLLVSVVFYGNAVAEGVAQEKGGRVMEVLLSRVRAQDLLTGKLLGIGFVGLTQILLAATAGAVAAVAVEDVDVPAAVPATLAMTVLWFALGYALWSVLFAAAGALVSRVEDLQSAAAPLSWILILSALPAILVQDDPDAWYIRLASFVPVTAPFVVPVRAALGHVAAWEVALAATITMATTYALVRLAAGVYSGALLRSGTRPGLGELWRAARTR